MVDLSEQGVPYLKESDHWAVHSGKVFGWVWKNDTKYCRRKRRIWCRFFHAYKTHDAWDRRTWCKCCAVAVRARTAR